MSNDESQKINSGNRLTDETSPYLLQHAHNPVAWYPWGNEALELARERGVPILLSIGYSACHWCHVMEHESFEDDDVAAVMNENFVCIKVDREERPDLDRIYQLSHQMMTRRGGGWPLTIFLTPNGHAPLFAGTYFPKTPRHGMPGFVDVMLKVQDHYEKHGHDLESHDAAFRDALAQTTESEGDKALTTELLKQAGNELALSYDSEHGGFGNAPKFPHPTHLDVLLRLDARETKDARPVSSQATPQKMLVHTLEAMAAGGLYDHLGGGFCRYSVDERWEIPHFEKMLYDNAQLLALYAEAWHLTKAPAFKTVCEETVRWIRMQMQASDGGYFSTVDADSEGEEGKFYVWTPAAVQALLTESEFALVKTHYGLDRPANFEGAWHLSIKVPYDDLAGKHNLSAGDIDASLLSARRKLEKERATRIPPSLDDKILTSWNGLMIRGMARAGHLLDEPTWIDSAIAAVDFVKDTLWQDGRLLATTRRGKTHLNAYLDDYVYLIDGLIELMQARWRDEDLEFAQALAESVLEHFQDTESGGFFFTSDDHERLLHRPKPGMDDATPSGNGIAALVFTRLGHLVGDVRYLKAAEDTFNFLSSGMTQYPSAFGSALVALEEHLIPTETVMIRYEKNSNVMAWQQVVRDTRRLNRLVVAIPSSAVSLPGVLADRHARADVTAYVCRGLSCDAPITALEPFREALTLSEPNTQ